jgi:hypothetical protein
LDINIPNLYKDIALRHAFDDNIIADTPEILALLTHMKKLESSLKDKVVNSDEFKQVILDSILRFVVVPYPNLRWELLRRMYPNDIFRETNGFVNKLTLVIYDAKDREVSSYTGGSSGNEAKDFEELLRTIIKYILINNTRAMTRMEFRT